MKSSISPGILTNHDITQRNTPMSKWLTWLDLIPVLIACMAVTLALVLGANPKQKRIKAPKLRILEAVNYVYQFRRKPFALGLPSLITLSSFVGVIALTMLNSILGPQSVIEPSSRLIPSPSARPTQYSTAIIAAISFGPSTYTPTVTPTNTTTPTHTPSPTSSDTPTLTPTIPTEDPISTPNHTPTPRSPRPGQVTPTDTPVSPTGLCSSYARIDRPARNSSHASDFAVVGNAYLSDNMSRRFDGYQVWLSQLNSTNHALEWFLIVDSERSVVGNELATISLASLKQQGRLSGRYAIKLRVVDNTGNYDTDAYPDCITIVRIDLPDD